MTAGDPESIPVREVEAERTPLIMEPTMEQHQRWKEHGGGARVPAGIPENIPVREVEAERPPCGVIMVEPTVGELRRWKGLWYPVPNARRKRVYVNGVVLLAPFSWRQIPTMKSCDIERGISEGEGSWGVMFADRATEAGTSSGEGCSMCESDVARPGVVETVEGDVMEAIRLKDVRIAAAAKAFDESTDTGGLFFDFRDGTRVAIVVYAEMSEGDRADMQIAEEEHLERLDVLRVASRAEDVKMAEVALAHEAFEASTGSREYYFDFRDGSRVRKREYRRISRKERAAMADAEEQHFERLGAVQEAVHEVDVRIAGLAQAYEESAEKDEFIFDHRDGSLVHIVDYWKFSREERAGVSRARLERSERMGGAEMAESRRDVTSGGEDAVVAAVAGVSGGDEGLGGAVKPSRADP